MTRITRIASAAFLMAALLSMTTFASAQAVFTTATAAGGQLIADQNTGAVTWCVALTGGTALSPTPTGVCAKIGTATPSATNPSLSISDWFSNGTSGGTSFITNVYTGKVWQCEYYYNSNTDVIYGDCAQRGTAST
ncbi:MAG: hypothetical protein JO261_09570 [Alphaproteobacteria bacterium]|nr:hypothetical protein [Alphaproteobacteria bacterium]MBV9693937.1 hypothetical protein [Alphaproteobacteria bacterium]